MLQVIVIGAHSLYVSVPLLSALVEDTFYTRIGKPIVVFTRDASAPAVVSDRLAYVEWTAATDLDAALATADLVINTTGPRSDWDGIAEAIVRHADRIQAYVPSEFGSDAFNFAIQPVPQGFQRKLKHAATVRAAGIKVIEVQTGAIDGCVGRLPAGFASIAGVNYQTNVVTFTGDADVLYHATWNEDVGRAVASLAALGNYATLPDVVNIFSYAVSQRQVAARYAQLAGVDLTYAEPVPYATALDLATEQSIAGDRSLPAFMQILHVLCASGPGKGLFFTENHRELVNPGEQYFAWKRFD